MLLHGPTVHFPIALLLLGSWLELLRPHSEREQLIAAFMLRWGWWSALLASLTGLLSVAWRWQRLQAQPELLNTHAATSLLILGVYWRLVSGQPPVTKRRLWLCCGCGLIVLTGFFGGRLMTVMLAAAE